MLPAIAGSAFHLLALGIGLGSVYVRGRALRGQDIATVLRADMWWGIAAVLWIGSGLARAFGGLEKGAAYYLTSHAFQLKMGLFAAIWALEVLPMITFIRWRSARARGEAPDTSRLALLTRLNDAEIGVLLLIPFVAAAMARGW